MAECNPQSIISSDIDPIETCINEKFDHLINCINLRRAELLAQLRNRQLESSTENTGRRQTLQTLNETKTNIQSQLRDNLLQSLQQRMTRDIDNKIRQLEVVAKGIELDCDTQQLEESISVLGQLVERDIISIPNYPDLLLPTLSVGKEGTDQGELKLPRSLAFDERTELIYVVNSNQSTACINVFTFTGEYMDTFCSGQFHCPIGIALRGDEVYLSDALLHCVFHFKLSNFQLVGRVGQEGSGKGEFSFPQQLTIAPNGSVFIADSGNNRVVVMDAKLSYKRSIKHDSMMQPVDVKLLGDKVYVLSYVDNPCLHVFSLSGKKIRSFITCGEKATKQVKEVYSFCFDKQQNILICDYSAESIKVFSQEGVLLHTLGGSKDREKRIKPRGIVITEKNELICVSYKTLFGVHIFF